MSEKRKIISVVKAVTGLSVAIGEAELEHALKHFLIPQIKLLEIIEQILLDPTEIYEESTQGKDKKFYLFYRLENNRYLVAVIKSLKNEAHFVTIYPTGDKIKAKHLKMKKLKL